MVIHRLRLVYDNDIDVLVLSEYDANVDELNKMFEGNNQRLTKCNTANFPGIVILNLIFYITKLGFSL